MEFLPTENTFFQMSISQAYAISIHLWEGLALDKSVLDIDRYGFLHGISLCTLLTCKKKNWLIGIIWSSTLLFCCKLTRIRLYFKNFLSWIFFKFTIIRLTIIYYMTFFLKWNFTNFNPYTIWRILMRYFKFLHFSFRQNCLSNAMFMVFKCNVSS